MARYNGHRSWAYWNVALWVNNDEGLYSLARECIRRTRSRRQAAERFMEYLGDDINAVPLTPDGAAYSVDKGVCAMRGLS